MCKIREGVVRRVVSDILVTSNQLGNCQNKKSVTFGKLYLIDPDSKPSYTIGLFWIWKFWKWIHDLRENFPSLLFYFDGPLSKRNWFSHNAMALKLNGPHYMYWDHDLQVLLDNLLCLDSFSRNIFCFTNGIISVVILRAWNVQKKSENHEEKFRSPIMKLVFMYVSYIKFLIVVENFNQ